MIHVISIISMFFCELVWQARISMSSANVAIRLELVVEKPGVYKVYKKIPEYFVVVFPALISVR